MVANNEEAGKRYTLHYAGQVFPLPAAQKDILDGVGDETFSVRLNLDAAGWLTIVLGPGISAAVREELVKPARARQGTIL